MDDPEALITVKIAEAEKNLLELKEMLRAVQTSKKKYGDPSRRFFEWRPVDAAVHILEHHGSRMLKKDLIELMVAGGISIGKKRPGVNIARSFNDNIELGNLIEDGDYIDIPRK